MSQESPVEDALSFEELDEALGGDPEDYDATRQPVPDGGE